MEAIKKLEIVFGVVALFMMLPLFYIYFQRSPSYLVFIVVIFFASFFLNKSIFKRKTSVQELEAMEAWWIGYTIGGILSILLVLLLIGTFEALSHGSFPPLIWNLALLAISIFIILLFYYSHQSQKDFRLKFNKEKNTKKTLKKKHNKAWITYILAIFVLAIIARFAFGILEFNLTNVLGIIGTILFFYLIYLFSSSKKVLKYRRIIITTIIAVLASFFLFMMIVSLLRAFS